MITSNFEEIQLQHILFFEQNSKNTIQLIQSRNTLTKSIKINNALINLEVGDITNTSVK